MKLQVRVHYGCQLRDIELDRLTVLGELWGSWGLTIVPDSSRWEGVFEVFEAIMKIFHKGREE